MCSSSIFTMTDTVDPPVAVQVSILQSQAWRLLPHDSDARARAGEGVVWPSEHSAMSAELMQRLAPAVAADDSDEWELIRQKLVTLETTQSGSGTAAGAGGQGGSGAAAGAGAQNGGASTPLAADLRRRGAPLNAEQDFATLDEAAMRAAAARESAFQGVRWEDATL